MRKAAFVASLALLLAQGTAQAQPAAPTVIVYTAGALRGAAADLAREAGPALGITISSQSGSAGLMRQRIEKGETADLFLSADMASPRKLQAEGRTVLPVAAFARNRMCVLTRKGQGFSPENLAERLADGNLQVKTSQPVADPSGDYAWAIFDKVDALHTGAGKMLKDKAIANMALTAPTAPGQSPAVALITGGKIDLTFSYCSGGPFADLDSFPVPDALDPHPVFGMAVLSAKPEVMKLALYLFSEEGQALLARDGFIPLGRP
jgi:molybdate transport system substrate-binding protein